MIALRAGSPANVSLLCQPSSISSPETRRIRKYILGSSNNVPLYQAQCRQNVEACALSYLTLTSALTCLHCSPINPLLQILGLIKAPMSGNTCKISNEPPPAEGAVLKDARPTTSICV